MENPHCLKSLNRMNDLVEGCKIEGEILLDGSEYLSKDMDVNLLEKTCWNGISETKSVSDEYL